MQLYNKKTFRGISLNNEQIILIHNMKDINECHNQTFLSRSNIYVCDNNGRDLYLLGVNVLVSQACIVC